MDENIEETEDIMEDLLKEDSEISATEGVLVLEVQVHIGKVRDESMQNLAWQIFPLLGANLKLLSNVECTFVDLDIVDLKNAKASAYPPLTGFQKLFDGPKRSNAERIVTKFAIVFILD